MSRVDDLARQYRNAYRATNQAGHAFMQARSIGAGDNIKARQDEFIACKTKQDEARSRLFAALDAQDGLAALQDRRHP